MNLADTSAVRWAELFMVPPSERKESLIMLASNAFFDESGTHDGSEIFAMGGLISSYDRWARFEIEWQKILASKGIKRGFHFNTFMARKGEFENGWSDRERDDFMERLCITISENIVVGIASACFVSDYESVVPEELRKQLRDPYYVGLYRCLYMVITWSHFKARVELPRQLRFLYDRKKKFEGLAADIYYAVRDDLIAKVNPDIPHPSIFGDMAFGDKEIDIPLQAADLLVGVAARNYLKARRKNLAVADVLEKSAQMLGKSGRILMALNDPPQLQAFVNIFRPGFYDLGPSNG